MYFEDLHVVVCDGDAACRLECGVTLHQRVEQDSAETAVTLVIALEVYLNFTHALQIVADRALGALNLVAEIVLAAGCNAGACNLTDCAVCIFCHEGHDVFVLYISHLGRTGSLRALREYGGCNGIYLGDIAHDELGDGQQMRAKITECAAACELVDVSPGDRQVLVEKLILIVRAGEAHDFAQCTALYQLANVSICRVHGVVEANIVDDALLGSKLSQFSGLLSGDGQRFLAVYVLAVFQSSLCYFVVECVRGCDVNQIDIRIGDNIVPVSGDALEADLLLCRLCSLFICVCYDLERSNTVIRSEQHLSVSECGRVCLAHPAGAYQSNANFFHFLFLLQYCFCMIVKNFSYMVDDFESIEIVQKTLGFFLLFGFSVSFP